MWCDVHPRRVGAAQKILVATVPANAMAIRKQKVGQSVCPAALYALERALPLPGYQGLLHVKLLCVSEFRWEGLFVTLCKRKKPEGLTTIGYNNTAYITTIVGVASRRLE